MGDLEFAFELPSDEEIDYDDVSSGGEDEEEEEISDVEEKKKTKKKTQSLWDFSSYTESVAEEHARRSTTTIDEKNSKLIQQRGHAEIIPKKDEVDEDGSSDSEPDRQEDYNPEEEDEAPTTASGGDNRSFFTKAVGVSFHANSFMDLHLSRPLLRAYEALGYIKPTPIQAACIPLALTGLDIFTVAVTVSGKAQEVALRYMSDLVVATPGRIIDHLRNSMSVDLDDLAVLILDEADRLLQLGFEAEICELVRICPKRRQTMLFSATMTEQVDELIKLLLNKPLRLSADPTTKRPSTLT